MFRISERCETDRSFPECDFIGFTFPSLGSLNQEYSQISIDVHRGDSNSSAKDKCVEIDLDVNQANDTLPADRTNILLANKGRTDLFSEFYLTISSGKTLNFFDHAHTICLLYNNFLAKKGGDYLSVGFVRDHSIRMRELRI